MNTFFAARKSDQVLSIKRPADESLDTKSEGIKKKKDQAPISDVCLMSISNVIYLTGYLCWRYDCLKICFTWSNCYINQIIIQYIIQCRLHAYS